MKLAFKLAFRNLMGGGLRTWLNVIVLAFTFLLIILYYGFTAGWNNQAKQETIAWEVGGGHLRNNKYDPYDPFSIADGHGNLPNAAELNLEPVLLRQASIFPDGRMFGAVLKGMNIDQSIVKIPLQSLAESTADLPVVIGKRMAAAAHLKVGDQVTMRWRDQHGAYDASVITVAAIFSSNLGTIDDGQIWLDIAKLREITGFPENEASYFISTEKRETLEIDGWNFHSQASLVSYIDELAEMDAIGASVMYLLLLAIALLAIFDTQVLSIFRRQKEIGTYISLGLTRQSVVTIFTVEGSMYSILATVVGIAVGFPLFSHLATDGITMSQGAADMAMAEVVYPVFRIGMIINTIALVVISATIVSFLPARKIARMNPVDALKGKMQ